MAHSSGRPNPAVGSNRQDQSTSPLSIVAELLDSPKAFSFSQAVRLLKRAFGSGKPTAMDAFLREQLRIQPYLSLGFPPNDLVAIDEIPATDDDRPTKNRRFKMTATFLGLYGPSSPLPTYYTEELLDEQSDDKSVSRDFLDIVNHGFFVLFTLADSYYRLSRQLCEEGDRGILLRLFALTGLGHEEMLKQIFRTPGDLLRATGLLTQFPRSAAGLRALLTDRIGTPVDVIQCASREAEIPLDQCCRLSREESALGRASWLGFTTSDATGKLVIIAGPMTAPAYRRLLPGRPDHDELVKLIRFYITQPLLFDIELVLAPEEAQPGRVGDGEWSQLGCDLWLTPPPGQEAKAVFPEPP